MTKKMIIPAILFFIGVILIYSMGGSAVAYAAESDLEFDKTYVLDDLEASAVNGVTFDVDDYPYDKDGDIQLIGFVEYGYSAYQNMQQNYGLYVYLYNPRLLDITDSSCKIQIGVGSGSAEDYNKYFLKSVSKSEGVTTNRFIKMKVLNSEDLLTDLNPGKRVYNVSGIEIATYGSGEIIEYNVSSWYSFSGYSKGYGTDPKAESTLVQQTDELETIEITGLLDRQTVYRDNIGNPSVTSHNQVNGVYFGLDEEYIDEFGLLQRIKAEWYEYRTSPILVVDNQDVYNALYNVRGVDIGSYNSSVPYGVYAGYNDSTYIINTISGPVTGTDRTYNWSYNVQTGSESDVKRYSTSNSSNKLSWVLKGDGDIMHSYVVSESFLKSYKADYENIYKSTLINDGTVTYSSDLFNTDVGVGRKSGYNVYEFDADADAFDFTDYGVDTSTYGGWQKFKAFFGWTPETESVLENQSPIEIIDNERYRELSALLNVDFARQMLIDEFEVDKFKSYCNSELAAGRVVIHFRFACTEYVTRFANVVEQTNVWWNRAVEDTNAFIAEENVFLNFDVLSLTFKNDDGEYRIFPVVNDPIDIISGIVGPEEQPSFEDEAGEWFDELGKKIKEFFEKSLDLMKIIGIVIAVIVVLIVIVLIIKLFTGLGGGSKSTTVVKIDPSMFKDKGKKGK